MSEALADVRADGHARPGAGGLGERAVVMLLVLLSGVPMLVLAWLRYRLHAPSGDEPHYLIISQAIEKYGSLEVQRIYDNRDNRIIMDAALANLPVRPRWFYEVQHLSTSLGLVEAGLGVAAVPRLAAPTGRHAVLVVRTLVDPVVTRIMGIIRRHGATLSPAAQQFHQILKGRWAGA